MKNKKIYVDIDETICFYSGKRDYNLAKPIKERIKKMDLVAPDHHTAKRMLQ